MNDGTKKVLKRDNYLDFIKGLAAINIILIHTTFWSGEGYVPEEIKTLSLALDVPFFFFCSGIGATYVKSFKKSLLSLLGLYKKYLIFLVFYYVCLVVFGIFSADFTGITLANFIHNLFFLRTENTALRVVMGSIWFMPVYYTVIPIGSFLVSKLSIESEGDERQFLKWSYYVAFIIFMGLIYTYLGKNFFYFSLDTLFYLFFFFLGVICSNKKICHLYSVIIIWTILVVLMKILAINEGVGLSNMQDLKFPPNIIYALYSLIVIVLVLYMKNRIVPSEKNVFCWIGRSAIYFYFCQGISSSILMYFVPAINGVWYAKLPFAFVLNFAMTFILVLLFKKICTYIENRSARIVKLAISKSK